MSFLDSTSGLAALGDLLVGDSARRLASSSVSKAVRIDGFLANRTKVTIRGREYEFSNMGVIEIILAALITQGDTRVDEVLDQSGFGWKDANGKEIWPMSPIERLATYSKEKE